MLKRIIPSSLLILSSLSVSAETELFSIIKQDLLADPEVAVPWSADVSYPIDFSPLYDYNIGSTFFIETPELGSIEMELLRHDTNILGFVNIQAVSKAGEYDAILTASFNSNSIVGTLETPNAKFNISTNGSEFTLENAEYALLPPEDEADHGQELDLFYHSPMIETMQDALYGPHVRILVLYTPAAAQQSGPSIDARVSQYMTQLSEVIHNSNLSRITFGLAGVTQIDDHNPIANTSEHQLNAIRTNDTAAQLRSAAHADIVVLLTANFELGNSCGRARLNASKAMAYAVVGKDCFNYTFAHEVGHIFGAQHDYDTVHGNESSNAAYPWGYGYRSLGGNYGTVMAYPFNSGTRRIAYFSSPSTSDNGETLGHETANNRRVLQQRANVVANFYPAAPGTTPVPVNVPMHCNGLGTLTWSAPDGATEFEVTQSAYPDMQMSWQVYAGTARFYRYDVPWTSYLSVRACDNGDCGEWSQPVRINYYPNQQCYRQ